MTDDLKRKRLLEIRKAIIVLNKYPEIIGNYDDIDSNYPETRIEKAYCALLWEIDEEIRRLK